MLQFHVQGLVTDLPTQEGAQGIFPLGIRCQGVRPAHGQDGQEEPETRFHVFAGFFFKGNVGHKPFVLVREKDGKVHVAEVGFRIGNKERNGAAQPKKLCGILECAACGEGFSNKIVEARLCARSEVQAPDGGVLPLLVCPQLLNGGCENLRPLQHETGKAFMHGCTFNASCLFRLQGGDDFQTCGRNMQGDVASRPLGFVYIVNDKMHQTLRITHCNSYWCRRSRSSASSASSKRSRSNGPA